MGRFRAIPVATATVLLSSGLAACGNSDVAQDDLSPAAVVRQAATSAQSQSVRYTLDVATGTGPMSGQGEYQAGPVPAGRMTFTSTDKELGEGTFEMIVIGADSWMKTKLDDAGAEMMPFFGSGGWMKLPAGEDAEDDLAPTDFDFRSQLQQMVAAGDVRELGEEDIEGEGTTHYAGTVTAAAVAASAEIPEDVRDELVDTLNDNKGDTADFDVWIDDDFQVRRYVERGTDGDGAYTATVTFRDFGDDIEIAAPPAAEVFEFPDFSDPKAMQKYEKQMQKEMEKKFGKDWKKELERQFSGDFPFPEDFEKELEKQMAEDRKKNA